MKKYIDRYIRQETFPLPFCSGCGHGILLRAILTAIDELGLNMDEMVFVSGTGCAGWIPSPHFAADTLHVTHGRPIAFATGVKLANPSLKVVVISGDGDLSSIGGNHLIHGARRNLDITVICANNEIFGMTGGQAAPTTPTGKITATTPKGNEFRPFDLCKLVISAGATYVARYAVTQIRGLIKAIKKALTHKGFSFLDIISPCFAEYGSRNEFINPANMLRALKKNCVSIKRAKKMTKVELSGKYITGEFTNTGIFS